MSKLFVFWILREAKQLCWARCTKGWDHPAAAPSLTLTPTSSLHSLSYSACSCSLVPLSLTLSYKVSLSICRRDTKMDGEAPEMGHTIDCATRWAASAAFDPVLPLFSSCEVPYPTRVWVCEGRGGLSGTVWQQMLLFGQKSERGLWLGGLAVSEHRVIFLSFFSLCLSFSVVASPQLCLPWRLSKRKCEGNGMMEYVSGARGFGLFCGRLH